MAVQSARVVLCLFILSLTYGPISTKPMFGALYCDFFCDDYDYDRASSSTSFEDLLDAVFGDPCEDCPTRPPRFPVTTINPMLQNPMQQMPYPFMFPPSSMNMTMNRNGNGWFMNYFWPSNFGGGPGRPPFGPFPATPTPAAATTAAPAGGNATRTNTTAAG